MLLPVHYYARAVAKNRRYYEDNNGSGVNPSHPSQELIWGHIDYPVTPVAHMRIIKAMGRQCREEMEAALPHVTKNRPEAQIALHYMKSHELLTIYYEKKVQAAIAALVHRYGNKPEDRVEAEKLAEEAVAAYETAIGYVIQYIDENRGLMKSKWANEYKTLPELIEAEKQDCNNMAELFNWPHIWSGKPVRFEENWDSGVIDPAKWLTNSPGTTKCELEHLGGGDYAIYTRGSYPDLEVADQHQNYFYSKQAFERGGNLRCTFKAWGDPTKPAWGGAFPKNATINGPWRFSNTANATSNQEACVSLWYGQPIRFSQMEWDTGPVMSDAFVKTWLAATSKDKALTIRVWLGDGIGAMCEWTADGVNWTREIDTRGGVGGSHHGKVYLGFASYCGAVFIDDIVVENDASR